MEIAALIGAGIAILVSFISLHGASTARNVQLRPYVSISNITAAYARFFNEDGILLQTPIKNTGSIVARKVIVSGTYSVMHGEEKNLSMVVDKFVLMPHENLTAQFVLNGDDEKVLLSGEGLDFFVKINIKYDGVSTGGHTTWVSAKWEPEIQEFLILDGDAT